MSPPEVVAVRVPASTANLGPGFDCLGLALDIHNTVELSLAVETTVEVTGEGQGHLALSANNLVLESAQRLAQEVDQQVPGWRLRQHNEIPLARGLGSSSAAIVGGLVAANELLDAGLSPDRLLQLATELEGHPDNVAPALYGGLTVCCREPEQVWCVPLEVPDELVVALAIPRFEVSTRQAREVLPDEVSFDDAVFNCSRSACTLAALVASQWDVLHAAMQDRLHQPYRADLVPGADEVMAAARQAGAYGAALSGSGPTVVAFATERREPILAGMLQAFGRFNIEATGIWATPSDDGAVIADEGVSQ